MYGILRTKKHKAIALISAVLVATAGVKLYEVLQFHIDSRKAKENLTFNTAHNLLEKNTQETVKFLRSRLHHLTLNPKSQEAFKTDNKELLLEIEKRRFALMRKENPGLMKMHYYKPGLVSYLRIHDPKRNGDDLSRIKQTAREAEDQKRFSFGIDPGTDTDGRILLRAAAPIFDNDTGRYLGVLELGFDLRSVVEETNRFLNKTHMNQNAVKSLILVNKSYLLEGVRSTAQYKGFYLLEENPLFQTVLQKLNTGERALFHKLHVDIGEKHYTIGFNRDFVGGDAVMLMTVMDITATAKQMHKTILTSVTKVFLELILLIIVINWIFKAFSKTLIQMHSRVDSILNAEKDVVFVTRGGKMLTGVNKAFLDFFGYPDLKSFTKEYDCVCDLFIQEDGYLQPEIEGKNWATYVMEHPEQTHMAKIARQEREYTLKVYVQPLNSGLMTSSEEMVVSLVDITEELEDQRRIEELMKQLEASLESFKALANSTMEAVLIFEDNICIEVNTVGSELFGYKREELLGMHRFKLIAEESLEVLKKGLRIDDSKPYEVMLKRKDGSTFPALVRGKNTTYQGKKVRISSAIDISEQKRQARELEKLNKHLREEVDAQVKLITQKDKLLQEQAKLAAMGEMIGSIAHQWRQPLNALNIGIELLEDDYEDGLIDEAYLEQYIEKNTRLIRYMSQTIDDFRNFFKTDKVKSNFHMKELLENLLALQSAQFQSHGIEVKIAGEDFAVYGYKSELQQVLLNIINNAKDAVLRDNRTPSQITIVMDAAHRTVHIDDNGGGIEEELLDRIFEPYFTTKEEGKGTGIGLYMARTIIVEHMHGALSAQNYKDGARFSIRLPESP